MTIWISGCASITATKPNVSVTNECSWTETIRPSRKDVLTRGTQEQIVTHNENREKNCPD